MIEFELLHSLGVMLLTALVVVIGARAVGVPNIVAYIGAGLLLGPAFGVLEVSHTIELISEFGIILLLFLVGLELSLDKIKEVGTTAFVAGVCRWGERRSAGACSPESSAIRWSRSPSSPWPSRSAARSWW